MTAIEEQQARHKATMDFFRSGKKLAEEIALEIRRLEQVERERLEADYRNRCVKPVKNEEEECK